MAERIRIAGFPLLIVCLLVLRRPDVLIRSQFWAEDGAVFFANQLSFGFLRSISQVYAGYLHTIPRLIAGLLQAVPVRWMPLAFNLCSLVIIALCCGAFYRPCFRTLLSSDALRACCCLVVATAIPVGGELVVSICTLQTFLVLLMVLLVYRNSDGNELADRRLRIEIPLLVVQVLIALSAPATLILTPFLLWQVFRNRGWRRYAPLVVMAAAIVQVIVLKQSHELKRDGDFYATLVGTAVAGISRSVVAPVLGQHYLKGPQVSLLLWRVLAGFAIFVVLLTWEATALDRTKRLQALAAAYIAIASLWMAMRGRNLAGEFLSIGGLRGVQGERYFFLAACMFIFIVAVAIDRLVPGKAQWLKAFLLIAVFSYGMKRNFAVPPLADLDWPTNAAKIDGWKAAVARQEKVGNLVLPINPPPNTMTLVP